MYNQTYEDYMKSILGYPINSQNYHTYQDYENIYYTPEFRNDTQHADLYPEIYGIIYPMVLKLCNENKNQNITNELVEQMTDNIYSSIESTNVEVNVKVETRNGDVINPNAKKIEEKRSPRPNNPILRDLIKILILRELLNNRPHNFPGRPPFPIRPERPPFTPLGPEFYPMR